VRYCPVIEICRLNAVTSRESLGSDFTYDSVDKVFLYKDEWEDEELIKEPEVGVIE
jgi:hypothetical protein